jgi:hypothetical protein
MRGKKAKALRRALRAHEIDPNERSYISREVMKPASVAGDMPRVRREIISVNPTTGRSFYQDAKRVL